MQAVILLGPSSVGKTTLCKTLLKEYDWYTTSLDQVFNQASQEWSSSLLQKLKEEGLVSTLSPYMSEANILKLAQTGEFIFKDGDISITHQFNNPDHPDIEAVLSNAGIEQTKINELIKPLHSVSEIVKHVPPPDMIDKIVDDIFERVPHDGSVIIDIAPFEPGGVDNSLQRLKKTLDERADQDRCPLDYKTVLAYCPPKALSARIDTRNKEASDQTDKREGLFPFIQLSELIATDKANEAHDEADSLSKLQLFEIAFQHLPSEVGKDSRKKANTILRQGVYQYAQLAPKFGLFNESSRNLEVKPRKDLVDATIDMSSSDDPHELASQLNDQIYSPSNSPSM